MRRKIGRKNKYFSLYFPGFYNITSHLVRKETCITSCKTEYVRTEDVSRDAKFKVKIADWSIRNVHSVSKCHL